MNIYVCGLIAYETAMSLLEERRAELSLKFPAFFIKQFEELKKFAANFCIEKNTSSIYIGQIGSGGIFRSLWEAGEHLGCGILVDVKKIPIRQEVIEICEACGENPYECAGKGSYIVIADDDAAAKSIGSAFVENITLTRIGNTTESPARVLKIDDRIRFLTPPKRQDKDIANRKGEI